MTADTAGDSTAPLPHGMVRTDRTLFQLSFPLFLHSLMTFAVMMLDTMFISAWSPDAAAAVALAKQILQIAFEVSSMVGVGAVIVISHNLGRGRQQEARDVATTAIFANTLLGLLLGLMLALFGPPVLRLLDTPQQLLADANLYLFIVAGAMVFNGFAMAAISCLRAFGSSRTILSLGVVISVVYIAAEYVLILGAGPFPALGVTGAALGTLLVRIMMAILLGFVLAKRLRLDLAPKAIWKRLPLVRRLFALSFPSVSDYIAYGFYQLVLLGFVAGTGVAGVLGRTYAMIAMAFLILVIMAVSQGNEVLLGYRRGAGHAADACRQGLHSAIIATVAATLIAIALWLLSDIFTGLFTEDTEVLALSKRLLLLTIFIQPGFAFNTILFQSLRAVGDVRWPVLASLAITWGGGLPLAWFLCIQSGMGVEGVWYAFIIEESVKAVFMTWRWTARGWQDYRVI